MHCILQHLSEFVGLILVLNLFSNISRQNAKLTAMLEVASWLLFQVCDLFGAQNPPVISINLYKG